MKTLSLLYPTDSSAPEPTIEIQAQVLQDLGFQRLLTYLHADQYERKELARLFTHLTLNKSVIEYRQDIFGDFLKYPALFDQFEELYELLETFRYHHPQQSRTTSSALYEVAWRISELETIVEAVRKLHEMFQPIPIQNLQSQGLQNLRKLVEEMIQQEDFQQLEANLPELAIQVRSHQSVTIGVNLNQNMLPHEAILLTVNDHKFEEANLLKKLFGTTDETREGIASLHGVISRKGVSRFEPDGKQFSPLMVPLFKDVSDVLNEAAKPVLKALRHYIHFNSQFLIQLRRDLLFYLVGVRLIRKMQTYHLPMCRPTIQDTEARIFHAKQNYNIHLALHLAPSIPANHLNNHIIQNEVDLGDNGRIAILTGPNQGGKTTYIQAIGLTQLLAQAGMYVPSTEAIISLVDGIYTHFQGEESLEKGTGRFGDEAQRFQEIFSKATRHSLLFLNESLISTNAGESLYIAQDIIRILAMMGTRAIFATHLHELATHIATMNSALNTDSSIFSLVASRIEADDLSANGTIQHSYKVIRAEPMGHSYARELAMQYGISYDQLLNTLQNRGVIRKN